MKLYTKTGDSGTTSLLSGQRVKKSDVRLHAYGTVDELNSQIGVCLSQVQSLPDSSQNFLRPALLQIQHHLFVMGGHLASSSPKHPLPALLEQDIQWLEQLIDASEAQLPPLKNFILPGGCSLAAHLHVARTICRRAERWTASVENHPPLCLVYLNRLGDLLFSLTRWVNLQLGTPETKWNSN